MAAQLGFVLVYQVWRLLSPTEPVFGTRHAHVADQVCVVGSLLVVTEMTRSKNYVANGFQPYMLMVVMLWQTNHGFHPVAPRKVANEIYPAEARTLGCGVCLACGRLAAMLGPLFFEGRLGSESGNMLVSLCRVFLGDYNT